MAIPSLTLTQEGRMYWYTVLLILGGLRLSKNSSSRLIDRLDMTSVVLSGWLYIKQIKQIFTTTTPIVCMCFILLFCLKNMFEIAVTVSTVFWLCWFIHWEFIKKRFFHFEGHSKPAVRQHIFTDIYLVNKLLYNLNLVQLEQCTKLNHELHRGVTFFYRLSVKRGRQYMYSTTIFPLKTHISEKTKSTDTNWRFWGTVW